MAEEAPRRLGVLLCFIWNSLGGVACQNTGALDPKAYGSLQGCLRKRCWRLSSYTSVFFFLRRYWGRKGFSVPRGAGFLWAHLVMVHFRAYYCDNL